MRKTEERDSSTTDGRCARVTDIVIIYRVKTNARIPLYDNVISRRSSLIVYKTENENK